MTSRWLVAILSAVVGLVGPTRSLVAEPRSRQHAPSASSKAADAARHFRRGVELYEDGDLSAAGVEFSRANQILPSFEVFYNLGQISYQRRNYVEAVYDFRRYLHDGGDEIAAGLRNDIERDVQRLEERIGRIVIGSPEEGANILLDDVAVGTTPLVEPIPANVGRREVAMLSKNGARQVRFVDIVGGETVQVLFRSDIAPERLDLRARPPIHDTGLSDAVLEPTLPLDAAPDDDSPSGSRHAWIFWSVAGLFGTGAAATGALAFQASRDLRQDRQEHPLMPGALDSDSHRMRLFGLASGSLLVGTALATVVAAYLTFSGSDPGDTGEGTSEEARLDLNR